MIPENLVFLSAQPYDPYFLWQVEVQIVNFRKHNISDKMQVLIWFPNRENVDLSSWLALAKKYPEVSFHFYKDTGVDLGLYIPQLRPHILAKHFDSFPELNDKIIFYHDSDIIFNYLPDFKKLCSDTICWQSDTSGYLDYDYLKRKEEQGGLPEYEAISLLCNIGKIPVSLMKHYTKNTGGAQYILKGVDGDFWRDVERMCLEIRKGFTYGQPNSINTKYFSSEAEGFQSWCADMWAVNMALWKRHKTTQVTPDLDFSWATDTDETYHKKPIYHNAGATGTQPGVFYKGHWIEKSPLHRKHSARKDSASYFYVEAIHAVK